VNLQKKSKKGKGFWGNHEKRRGRDKPNQLNRDIFARTIPRRGEGGNKTKGEEGKEQEGFFQDGKKKATWAEEKQKVGKAFLGGGGTLV